MDVTLSELLGSFMEAPLVLWVRTLGPLGSGDGGPGEQLAMFMELVDGVFLHKVMTHIDPSPTNQRLSKNVNNDAALRLYNLAVLTRHIKTFYQEALQQLIVMPLPNILHIAKDPLSARSMEELRSLLLLILGCAVQSERKEEMIEKIKLLDIETQAAIVAHIQEVTHNQLNVLDLSWMDDGAEPVPEDLEPLSRNMAASLRHLIEQRDKAAEVILELTQERDFLSSQLPQEGSRKAAGEPNAEDRRHLSVELADAKAKLRRYRQELEEKTEHLMDSKHELERLDQELQKLRQENQSLSCEARSARAYRDEVDALRERAGRVDRLEAELGRCREKLNDVHFYKSRVEELREDNSTLLETKTLLEEQLAAARGRCDRLHSLEKDNLLLSAKIQDLEMERDGEQRRLEELLEENMLLEMGQKQSMNESAHLGWELERLAQNHASEGRMSLVHELHESASSRALKLDKENRQLQATLEELKELNQNQQLHAQQLERENQSLSSKLECLQSLLDQEKLTNQDMESLGEELLKDKQRLERRILALQADAHRQVSEPDGERRDLSEEASSPQDRAQSSSEDRVRQVEDQNRRLHQSVSDTAARLASMEARLKAAGEEAELLRERAGRCEEAEALSREVASLRVSSEGANALEEQLSRLQQEAQEERLSKENLELRRCLESLRSSRLPELQVELTEAQEEAQRERKRAERLEQSQAALSREQRHLEEELQRSRKERQEADGKTREARNREEKLNRELEELREERRRRQEGDEERQKLRLDLEASEKSRKLLEKENLRSRTALQAQEQELEEKSSHASAAEKQKAALTKELQRLKEAVGRAKEMERQNKELQKEATIHNKTLAALREELVTEKLNVQQLNVQVDKLTQELDRMGPLKENTPRDRSDPKESLVEEQLRLKEHEIRLLQTKLEESGALSASLRRRLAAAESLQPMADVERGATAELLRIKDHLISVEKSNASLQTETSLLKEQLKQLGGQNASLSDQMAALQRHASTLQEQNSALHTQTARLQVENSTLSSQSASLMAQNAVLQGQVGALETEAESWQRQREEAWRARESVLADHERLLSVHERQAHEYEQLIMQHAAMKGQQRALESEQRALHSKYGALLPLKEQWEELEGRGQQEVQKNHLLQQENLQLKAEVDRLNQNQAQQADQNQNLQQRLVELKSLLGSAQQEVGQWTARHDSLKEQHQNLDIAMTKLDNHCELLSRLKRNLEEENLHLLSQINLLSQQNQALLERSMESKELYHQEQKLYIDKLNALRRQKEKLEEKIMDQYKFYDPTPKKRGQWSGAKALVKLIKPRKESGRDAERYRDRSRSVPDIPLPATPPLLPPESPPTAAPGSESLSNRSNHSASPGPPSQSPAGAPAGRGPIHRNRLTSTPNTTQTGSSRPDPGGTGRSRGPFDEDLVFGGRPGSGDYSRNTSSSSSPVTCRDAPDRPPRSTSLSSDDVVGLSQSQPSLSRSSTLPYDHTPQRAQPQRGGGTRAKPRPGSPAGSEMVTLEEFLEESNLLSPPQISTGSSNEMLTDYFARSPAPSSTPTNYVSPTIHSTNQRLGQAVKPSPRQPAGQSLSRAFSLASADLLRSQGPDGYRGNEGDGVRRRQGGGSAGRERPLSARFVADDFNRGEVAMVTPVRAVQPDGRDSAPSNEEAVQSELPKSTPASPDPNNDPQTVWYEYGCV